MVAISSEDGWGGGGGLPDSHVAVLLLGDRPQLELKYSCIALICRWLVQDLQTNTAEKATTETICR